MHHDAAIVGDIAPSDNVTKEVKNQLETEAMQKMRGMLGGDSTAGKQLYTCLQPLVHAVLVRRTCCTTKYTVTSIPDLDTYCYNRHGSKF